MVVRLNPEKYARLCALAVPKVIANKKEMSRMAEFLEELEFWAGDRTAEELALMELLTKLIEDYDNEHYPLPDVPPHKMVAYLMEQRGLRQIDLVPLLGSRAQVSDLVTGKRSISKAQAKKLAAFFKLSTDLFL